MPRYEILPGLPAYGPMALPFSSGGWTGAWSGHREGLVIRFDVEGGESWVGNFQLGSGAWEGVLEHPNRHDLIVVARGQGYVVDPKARQLVWRCSGRIQSVVHLPELGAIVFSDGLGFEAINKDGIWWKSPRISWDEIRNIRVEGRMLRGEASAPVAHGNEWAPFTVDLMTGKCEDGIYEEQMCRAIPVKPNRG